MDDTSDVPESSVKAVTEPPKEDRLMENFELFIKQLTHVADAIGLTLDKARAIQENYEGTSKSVPRVMAGLIDNFELIQTQIVSACLDMTANSEHYAHNSPGADGRGTWRQVLKMLLRIVGEVMSQMSQLPAVPRSESTRHHIGRRYTQSHVLPVLEEFTSDLKVLALVWPTLILVTMDPNALTEDEGKALLAASYTHPFWYSYDSYMTRFRNLFDLLKLSILNSYKKSGFFTKNFHRGFNGLQAIFTGNKNLSKQADELGKSNANIHFVKELWNLAETGLPEKFISWMKPSIKTREYFRLTLTPEMKAKRPEFRKLVYVRVLHLYHATSGGVKVPKEWHTHSPYSSHDLEAQQMVASALMDVEKTDAAEEEQRLERRAKLKKQLMDEYEREKSKGFDQTKETRRVSQKIARIEKEEAEEKKSASKELKKLEKEERRRSKAMAKSLVQASKELPDANKPVTGGIAMEDEEAHEDADKSLESSGRSSPDLEQLFQTMPLDPFLEPTEVEKYRLSISGEDLADITDAEDPALKSVAPEATSESASKSEGRRKSKKAADEVADTGLKAEKRRSKEAQANAAQDVEKLAENQEAVAAASDIVVENGTAEGVEPTPSADVSAKTEGRKKKKHRHSAERHGTMSGETATTSAGASAATANAPTAHKTQEATAAAGDEHDVVLHFHGGGFVSGSPSSHETYLRTWANNTNAVVFSVDYSLGPEFRYPVAFNECFFFYDWLVSDNNPLGFRPRKIILSGDSAGGNLAVAVALKAADTGIRKPDGLVVAYPALNCTKGATPSRVVFGNDVLVPYYFLEVCLDSYVDHNTDPHKDYCISPLYASDELISQLPDDMVFMVAGYDPLLDDSVAFLRRLDKLNKPYIYEVYECPHGFWNFDAVLAEAERAMYRAGMMIRCMIDPNFAKLWQIAEEKLKRSQATAGNALQFSIARALPPYPARTPPTFKPFTEAELIYQFAHASRPRKQHQAANGASSKTHPPTTTSSSSSSSTAPTTQKTTTSTV